jgi:hypothetical protein
MPFFTFTQSNSGGDFHTDLAEGIAEFVIIEAANADEANDKAERIGIYFDGVSSGADCPCCGSRWYRVSDRDADPTPLVYGKPPQERMRDFPFRKHAATHYADGRIEIVKKEA